MKVSAIDLFCGIGGLTHGLQQAGINVVAGYDIDASCKYAYEANNNGKFYAKDVAELSMGDLDADFLESDVKILVGCAPCQPFSTYSFKSQDSKKWGLLYEFARIIKKVQPSIISMENVPRLASFTKAPVFNDFISSLRDNGYSISYEVVNCVELGVPQRRKRLVLLASKLGEIPILKENQDKPDKTVRDAIYDMPALSHGEKDASDPLHQATRLSEKNLQRIKQSTPGGTWKDWDEELRLDCHKKSSGQPYVGVYGRMEWDQPSPTITTH